jgi:diaminopimelate decarboxylase
VYLETGRAIVDEAGWLISTVDAIKRLPDGTKSYIIDAGVNLLYTSAWYNYKVEIDREVQGAYENSVIYGPLCMNIDVVVESAFLPPLPRGTRIILSPMGAYNVTQWMQFIRYRPAVVMIMEDGKVEQIRRPENLQDIVGPESVPEKLKKFDL